MHRLREALEHNLRNIHRREIEYAEYVLDFALEAMALGERLSRIDADIRREARGEEAQYVHTWEGIKP